MLRTFVRGSNFTFLPLKPHVEITHEAIETIIMYLLLLHCCTGNLIIADGSVEFCEATPIGLVDEPKVSLYGRETDHLRSACRCVA